MIFLQFIAFPSRKDALLQHNNDIAYVESSGSVGLYIKNKCVLTYPNQTLVGEKTMDWCSNIAQDSSNMPWITFSLKGKSMKLNGFSLRNGCCWYYCCCDETGKVIDDVYCCCELYSFSLLGSNDNITWKLIHKVEKEAKFYECQYKTYDFDMTESFKYIKFVLDQERPGCPRCMQINQIELYGDVVDSQFSSYENDDNDESVSIIGKVRRLNE